VFVFGWQGAAQVRWGFWIVVAAVTIWVFADLLIRH